MYFLLFYFNVVTDLSSPFYYFAVIAVFANCCTNPFTYSLKYKEFHLAFARLVRKARDGVKNQRRACSEYWVQEEHRVNVSRIG